MSLSNHPIIRFLASSKLVFFTLPWLMLLLFAGTIVQRSIGLFEAERLFFNSWFVWFGFVPLPGLYSVLALLTVGLITKLVFKYSWKRNQAGSILTHIGVLVLLIGGLVTALQAEEGFIALEKGEPVKLVSDYHKRELIVFKNEALFTTVPFDTLSSESLSRKLPFKVDLTYKCRNCAPKLEAHKSDAARGLAAEVILENQPLEKEDEANLSGISFTISGTQNDDGIYVLYEAIGRAVDINYKGDDFKLILHKQQRALPFQVRLNDFKKTSYDGSDIASEYQSEVSIIDESGIEFTDIIYMNDPLRTQGYTLYQSSFIDVEQGEPISIIAVVKNKGFWFPYLASVIIGVGLILQTLSRLNRARI